MIRSLLLGLTLLCTLPHDPSYAQTLDTQVDARVLRIPVHIAPKNVQPVPAYSVDFSVWPPLPEIPLGSMPVTRPSRFVGSVSIDHGYYTQNRYEDWVSEYKVYTQNMLRVGTSPLQALCTQVCGQMDWGNGSVYALAPFAGVYHGAPTPTPFGCEGLLPNSDWHFSRCMVSIPVSIDLAPGSNPISIWSVGGMATWNNIPQAAETHQYSLDIVVHTVRIDGWIVSR